KKRCADLRHVDLRHLPDADREPQARRLAYEESGRPFDLARDSTLRCSLFQLAADRYLFLYVIHHIAVDAISIRILYRDFSELYNALTAGREPKLPEMSLQYSDFAWWQQHSLDLPTLESLKEYWKHNLTGAALVNLPLDFPRPALLSGRGHRYFFSL